MVVEVGLPICSVVVCLSPWLSKAIMPTEPQYYRGLNTCQDHVRGFVL